MSTINIKYDNCLWGWKYDKSRKNALGFARGKKIKSKIHFFSKNAVFLLMDFILFMDFIYLMNLICIYFSIWSRYRVSRYRVSRYRVSRYREVLFLFG